MTTRQNRSEEFIRRPWRVTAALIDGQLTRDQFVQLTYLIDVVDHKARGGVLLTTLRVIADETSWAKSLRRLAQTLDELETSGWLEVRRPAGGPRARWSIRLTGAALQRQNGETDGAEISSYPLSPSSSGGDATPVLEPSSASSRSVPFQVPQTQTQTQTQTEEQPLAVRVEELEVPALTDADSDASAGLTEDVLEAVNRGRAKRGAPPLSAADEAVLDQIGDDVFSTAGLPPSPIREGGVNRGDDTA